MLIHLLLLCKALGQHISIYTMSSFLELSSPSQEERLNEGAAPTTYDMSNDEYTGTTATPFREDEQQEIMHGPIQDTNIGMRGDYTNYNDHLRDNYAEDTNDAEEYNQTELSREQRAWIQKQKQTINEEDNAAQHNTLQNQSTIQADDENEVPQSYDCTDIPLPHPESIDDAAAISVMVYLLVIAFLLAISIFIGTVVVSQYGFIVLVAVIIAIGAMLLVFVVVMSVIQGDRKLTKARSRIHKWSMDVKAVIMKEVADLKEDLADYSSGLLLLTYEGETTTSDYVRDDFDNKESNAKRRRRRKPKSMIFRLAISPLKKMVKTNHRSSNNSTGKKRSWFGKKKKKNTTTAVNNEEGPSANYYVPPSENFEVV